jgi:cytochrome c556
MLMSRVLLTLRNGCAVACLAAGILLALVAILTNSLTARGAERVPGLTGTDRPDDVVQARQLLMDGIDAEMMAIDLAGAGKEYQLDELKAHADRISTLLTAFPHLFPPQTKPAATADGSPSLTTATPEVWENFDDFYGLAQSAATTALDATRAETADKFKELGKQLRAACDGCHAKYMHVDTPARP